MTSWDLSEKIHEFHDDIARALYKSYTMNDTVFSVAFGLHQGVISESDIPESAREDVIRIASVLKK